MTIEYPISFPIFQDLQKIQSQYQSSFSSFEKMMEFNQSIFHLSSISPEFEIFGNDPAAGSPTATLLRLLLPLAEKHCLDSGAELVAKNEQPSPKLYPTANR